MMVAEKLFNETIKLSSLSELRWQCRRGMLELDILLNTFLDTQYSQLSAKQRETFEVLLSYPDQTLLELLMDKMVSSNPAIAEIVKQVRTAINPNSYH